MKRFFLYVAAFSLLTLSSCGNQRTTDNSDQIIAHKVDSLLKKKWIFNKNGAICLNHFEEKLLDDHLSHQG